ncbi:FecR family protein [Pedobacter sp. UBA5917]|jgi:ferric-dicitrate binding protein FerR (iron transport regulator)|uniref:FecR family protein n=1 Tax=Pedobacter sp. UBA5917 TaxID=1947061 RepID=UPI0025EE9CC3|nr:FecR family protein [Pedobacter sp. UBA5917]
MPQQVDKALIEKFLKGSCSKQEEELVRIFLKNSESEALLNEILSANQVKDFELFDGDDIPHIKQAQWRTAINLRIAAENELPVKKRFSFKYAAIWAALLIVTLSVYLMMHFGKPVQQASIFIERNNPNGQRSKITLSDSSVVYLGAGSRLRYPERFSTDKREISLYGEAFFEVTKNPKKPFIIHTGTVRTQVLGTSFKIKAFKNKPLSVEVATGKVRVDELKGNKIESLAILIPGQKVIYFDGKASIRDIAVSDVTGFKTSQLAFRNSSLFEICETLERWYNVKISFKSQRKSRDRMTLTIDATVPVNKLLNVLAAAGKFSYNIKNNEIIIR